MTSLPIKSVAADANVLLAAIAARAAARVFAERPDLMVVTTEVTLAEVHKYIPEFARRYGLDVDDLREVAGNLPVRRYKESAYRSHLALARHHLGHRDPDDVALGALALKLNVPVWSNDNDLRELPLTVYTTVCFCVCLECDPSLSRAIPSPTSAGRPPASVSRRPTSVSRLPARVSRPAALAGRLIARVSRALASVSRASACASRLAARAIRLRTRAIRLRTNVIHVCGSVKPAPPECHPAWHER